MCYSVCFPRKRIDAVCAIPSKLPDDLNNIVAPPADLLHKSRDAVGKVFDRTVALRAEGQLPTFLFDLQAPCWHSTERPWTRPDKWKCSKRATCSLGSMYYRVGHRLKQGKFEVLSACVQPFHEGRLDDVVQPIVARMERCDKCVDKAFTRVWARRLRRGGQQRAAHRMLHRCLPYIQVSSLVAELKHILGQDVKHPKRRGRAPKATTVATNT